MKYIKCFENHSDLLDLFKKLSDQLDRLKTVADFINRDRFVNKSYDAKGGRNISKEFDYYFYDMTDEGWEYVVTFDQFYIEVLLKKPIKNEDAEDEFNFIVDRMNGIKDRLINEGFNPHYLISFARKSQQDLNDKTHKNDLYNFKGIGSQNSLDYYVSSNYWFKTKSFNTKDYFLGEIKLIII